MTTVQSILNKLKEDAPVRCDCHACGKSFPMAQLHDHRNNMFCEDCLENMGLGRCNDCREWVEESNAHFTSDDEIICDTCYENSYFTCERCSNVHHNDDLIYTAYDYSICSGCYDRHYFTCESCGEVYHSNDCYTDDDTEQRYCESCYDNLGRTCDSCGRRCPRDEMTHLRNVGDVCSRCSSGMPIHHYGFKPDPIFFPPKKIVQETENYYPCHPTQVYMGIELEIHCQNIMDSLNVFNDRDKERLYCKEDGSVRHGFEIVSHPMTLEGHREFDWVDFCQRMYDSGAKGNLDNHGIHIHISKTYMSEVIKRRISWFMCHHFDEVAELTRRESVYCQGADADEIIERIKKKHRVEGSRSEILYWGPEHTVEFRLPLSSLRGETVMATFELCDAVVNFVQNRSIVRLMDCWDEFLSWCRDNGYKALVGYYLGKAWRSGLGER